MREQINKIKNFKQFVNEGLIDWSKIEQYWNNLSSKEKERILLLDDFADADYYKDFIFNSLPTPVQNNLLKFLPKFEK